MRLRALALLAAHAVGSVSADVGKGCKDAGADNYCAAAAAGDADQQLCRYNTTAENQHGAKCTQCDYPCSLSTGGMNYKAFNVTNKGWNFFNMSVDSATSMRNIEYRISIPADAPNVSLAMLVGRCLPEVECGKCPSRCAILAKHESKYGSDQSRVPQLCTIPEYCPGCTADGCSPWTVSPSDTSVKAIGGMWKHLKSKVEDDANFYLGVYAMSVDCSAGACVQSAVQANLTFSWNAEGGAFGLEAPQLLLLLCVCGLLQLLF